MGGGGGEINTTWVRALPDVHAGFFFTTGHPESDKVSCVGFHFLRGQKIIKNGEEHVPLERESYIMEYRWNKKQKTNDVLDVKIRHSWFSKMKTSQLQGNKHTSKNAQKHITDMKHQKKKRNAEKTKNAEQAKNIHCISLSNVNTMYTIYRCIVI